jgi:cysteine desulfurase
MIYLDNSATTPLAPEVGERMSRWRSESFANASSAHRGGQRARVELEDARERMAAAIGAEPKEIIFTSGGTESNNYALKGYAFKMRAKHGAWPAIVTARSEHHAILHPTEFLEGIGAPIIFLDVDAEGRLHPEGLREALRAIPAGPPPLVTVMHANNETGTINPIAALAAAAHEMGALFHTDAVQSFGKLDLRGGELGADMISISAHKIHGPKGIGALYVNKEIELESLMHGGAQERNRRGGTEAVELVVGFDEATALALDRRAESVAHMTSLSTLLRSLLSGIEGIRFVTPATDALPNIVNVTFDDASQLDGEALIVGMDLRGIAVSNGSACTSGSLQPSHVLSAMGYPPEQAKAAVRFSLSRYNTEEEIRAAAEALAEVKKGVRYKV